MELHYIIILCAVAIILSFQIVSIVGTWRRMRLFSSIFGAKEPLQYALKKTIAGEVEGFRVSGGGTDNPYFKRINESINEYVANNETIDFQLLKDTVDANCDSIEDDIHTQIPIPLYLGLAGTMAGIIIGVGYLWVSGDLDSLMSVTPDATGDNTKGIVVLLGGVAIAMFCSIVGLIMTTFCTWWFKGCKLVNEQRKSDLFAWMQQNLLPVVARDDLQAIGRISRSLQSFNSTFKQHTDSFSRTLQSVQSIMTQQQTLAKTVSQMGQDATEMARANAIATQRLERNAEKLEAFNDYLESINGYIASIRRYTEMFKDETLRLQALEEIRDFFKEERSTMKLRNDAMKSKVGKFDDAFKKAMDDLRRSMTAETKDLQKAVAERTLTIEEAIKEQRSLFINANKEIVNQLREQFSQLPQALTAINEMKQVPAQMQKLLEGVQKANQDLVRELKHALPTVVMQGGNGGTESGPVEPQRSIMPTWLKVLLAVGIVVIASATAFSSYNTWRMTKKAMEQEVEATAQANVSGVDTVSVDSLVDNSVKK